MKINFCELQKKAYGFKNPRRINPANIENNNTELQH